MLLLRVGFNRSVFVLALGSSWAVKQLSTICSMVIGRLICSRFWTFPMLGHTRLWRHVRMETPIPSEHVRHDRSGDLRMWKRLQRGGSFANFVKGGANSIFIEFKRSLILSCKLKAPQLLEHWTVVIAAILVLRQNSLAFCFWSWLILWLACSSQRLS